MPEACIPRTFTSLAEATAAIRGLSDPVVLIRFATTPDDDVVIAANDAAAATPFTPAAGEHPDRRRDRSLTADIEIGYLHRQLLERGHARQVIALDGGHLHEVTVTRVKVEGDDAVYGFASGKPRS